MSKTQLGVVLFLLLLCNVVETQSIATNSVPDLTEPLTLTRCVQMAMQSHPDVQTAHASAERARAATRIAQSQRYPQLVLRWSARETQSLARPINIGGGVIESQAERRTQRDAAVALDYTLYQSGRSKRIQRAKTNAQAAELGIDDTRRLLTYEVRAAYYDVLAAKRYSTVAMRALATAERHRELVQARIELGQAPKSDMLPVNVEVAQARLEGIRAETDLDVSYAVLRALLGLPAGSHFTLVDIWSEATCETQLDELLMMASEYRPDLAQQRLSVQASTLSVKEAQINAGLTLDLTVSAESGRYTGTSGETWSVRAGAVYPLFDAGASKAQVTSARADLTIAQSRLEQMMREVQNQVESAFLQLYQAQIAIDAADAAHTEAQSNLDVAEARYAEGPGSIIEITDAQLALLRAETNQVQTHYDKVLALAALSRAVGRDFTTPTGDAQ